MLKNIKFYLIVIIMFIYIPNVNALTGIVNVNDSLTLRDAPTTSGAYITSFYNATELNILNTNAGTGNGCSGNWYQVQYGNYTGYSCGEFIVLNNNQSVNAEDDSYRKSNYDIKPSNDGTIMCYEDTGSVGIRNSVGGSKTGAKVDCGETVDILSTVDRPNTTCPYWYQIKRGNDTGYICGYFVNTTKLSSTANNYYNNNASGDTIEKYKQVLTNAGFPESYHPYLLELHARHPNWSFIKEQLNMSFDDAVNGEAVDGRNLLQGSVFDKGYLSTASHTYNLWNDSFNGYASEPGYYNASKEAIAYYMDPRNYLNEKYIFSFETLGYSTNQNTNIVSSIVSNQSFWPSVYGYYSLAGAIQDSKGNVSADIVDASSRVGISAVHVASRIKQEISGLSTTDSRIGGLFSYNGTNYANHYNFFNIKSSCKNCSSIYSGYAFEQGWNTPYKGIFGGASFMYNGYISLNQDTIYYEKFDVSTTNGHYTHQYMQNLAAPIQEGGIKYKGYVEGLASYLNTEITFVIPVYKDMPTYAVTAPKLGSPNNYLSGLSVDGTSVSNFSYNTYNYNVYLNSNKTKVNIVANKMINSSNVTGEGEIDITSDNQTNQIVVTSESGKVRIYTINFIRENKESTTVSDAMNNSGFKYNDNYLFGINIGTNVSEIIGNISSYNHRVTVEIKDKNGNLKTNDSFRTGDKVTITGNDGTKTYTVLIYGDSTSDGLIDKKDLLTVQSHVFGFIKLNEVEQKAVDINKDGVVDKKDLLAVQSHVFGFYEIKQG